MHTSAHGGYDNKGLLLGRNITYKDGGIRMSEHAKGKPNYKPTNPDKKIPLEEQRGKGKSNARGKTR